MEKLPIIGITMGDACGIGPEITARALSHPSVSQICRPVIVGSAQVLRRAVQVTGTRLEIRPVQAVAQAEFAYGIANILDQPFTRLADVPFGQVTAAGGRAAFCAVERVIELAMAGEIAATVTGPLHKEAMNLAGYHYSGHTEIYAEKTGTREYAMLLVAGKLKVVHVSTHVSLREACNRVKQKRVEQVIALADKACRDLGIQNPHIAVAGLNPHAGENGLFGTEEIEEIAPAVQAARKKGIAAEGPLPPDTVFSKARGGMYDIVVAMYHDQGHIPLKVLGFVYEENEKRWKSVSGVNITLGLPIIRTSVDHGTAFDQAGKNTATEESLLNAIDYAVRLARTKHEGGNGAWDVSKN